MAKASSAHDHALRMLARAPRTEAEIRRALAGRGFGDDEIDAAIGRLRELKYLDDASLAIDRAASLLGEGRTAPRQVVEKLIRKGVSERDAEHAVERAAAGVDEKVLAARALGSRRPRVTASSPLAERVKAARWLLGRGFSEEVARALLDLEEEPSPE